MDIARYVLRTGLSGQHFGLSAQAWRSCTLAPYRVARDLGRDAGGQWTLIGILGRRESLQSQES